MMRKGINYDVGIEFSPEYVSRPIFDPALVRRELEIIRNDLHCNAVRISGTDLTRLVASTEFALEQGLEVWLSPHLIDKTPQETLAYIVRCAAAAERLRRQSPNLVFVLGCELTLFMQGILPGSSFMQRLGSPLSVWWRLKFLKAHNKPLNAFLAQAIAAVRDVFHGPVTYAAAPIEAVDWSRFDFVALDYYRAAANRGSYARRLERHFSFGKPVVITEVGLCAYQGAEDRGARGFMIIDPRDPHKLDGAYVRDEALQARELIDMLGILAGAGVDGAFAFTFVTPALTYHENPRFDLDMAGYGLVKSFAGKRGTTYPGLPWEPKLAFHALAAHYAHS